jgi:hypothetical protein
MIGVLKGLVPLAMNTTPGGEEPQRWIVIAIVSWGEAEIMRSKLESENIPCLLQREGAGMAIGLTIGPMGEVKVLVPEHLADRATELLSTNDIDDEEIDEDAETSDDTDGEETV